jgi:hypothetical protein
MTLLPPTASPPRGPARPAAACLLALLGAAMAGAAPPISMAELNDGFARAAADLVTDQAACNKLSDNPRDLCREQARARSMVTRAELELARSGTRKSQDYLTTVKLDTAYDVARTRCNDQTGDAKTACTKSAQAARTQGQTDMKLGQRESVYTPTTPPCDTAAADARPPCAASAPARAPAAKAGKT